MRDVGGLPGQFVGLPGVLAAQAYRGGQLFHAGSGFLERCRLFFRATAQVRIARGDLSRCPGNAAATLAHAGDDLGQAFVHVAQCRQQAAGLVPRHHGNPAAQVAARYRLRHVHGRLHGPGDGARDQQPTRRGKHHGGNGHDDQQVALRGVVLLQLAHRIDLARIGELGIGVGRLDQRRQQGAAFFVHLEDGLVALGGEREVDDGDGHRTIARLHAVDLAHQVARGVTGVAVARHHVLELCQLRLHVFMRAQRCCLLHGQLLRLADKNQVTRRDGAPVHGGPHQRGDFGARVDAVHVAGKAVRGLAQRA